MPGSSDRPRPSKDWNGYISNGASSNNGNDGQNNNNKKKNGGPSGPAAVSNMSEDLRLLLARLIDSHMPPLETGRFGAPRCSPGPHPLGSGAFGAVYEVACAARVPQEARFELIRRCLSSGRDAVLNPHALEDPAVRGRLERSGFVAKMQVVPAGARRRILSENHAHLRFNQHTWTRVGGLTLSGYDFSPVLVGAATVTGGAKDGRLAGRRVRITFMEKLGKPFETIGDYLTMAAANKAPERRAELADVYHRVELAMAMLWSAGLAHTDMHDENVMVKPSAGEVRILDFGYAVDVGKDAADHMRRLLSGYANSEEHNFLNRAFADAYDGIARRASVNARKRNGVSPDSELLELMREEARISGGPIMLAARRRLAGGAA
jgi:hypothetical protein